MYLGEQDDNDGAILDEVHGNIVSVPARRAPSMQRVRPSEPELSFLMIKLDADMSCEQVLCGSNGCGSRMPAGADQLSISDRAVIRSWIANGAPRHEGAGGSGGGDGGGGSGGEGGR
jgi:hypothetical protein